MLFFNYFSNCFKDLVLFKKLSNLFISLLIIFLTINPFFYAYAATANSTIGGWSVVSNIGQGIGSKLTATKDVVINGASKTLSATANITPNPANVAKFLAKAGTLSLAIDAMNSLLDGVDYVMDPANNTLTYKNKPADLNSKCNSDNPCSSSPTLFYSNGRPDLGYFSSVGPPGVLYAQNVYGEWFKNITFSRSTYDGQTYFVYLNGTEKGNQVNDVIVYVNAKSNPYYDPSASDNNKPITVPLSNIGSQVIDQAEKDIRAGNPTSSAVALSRAVAQDMIVEAQTDDVKARPIVQQLEKSQAFSTTETAEGTVTNPDITDTNGQVKPVPPSNIAVDFPVFCGWAPVVCQAAQTVVQSVAEVTEYFKEKTEDKEKTEVELQDIPEETKKVIVSIGDNNCPSMPVSIHTPFNDIETDISPTYLCEIAKGMKTFFVALGFFTASMIVGRRN